MTDQTNDTKNTDLQSCGFCGKSKKEVKKLIQGTGDSYICDSCVNLCYQIILDDQVPTKKRDSLPSPAEIHEFLNNYVISQDRAKKILSVSVYNHYKRIDNPLIGDVEVEKSNVLLIGPTGVGKAQPLDSKILTKNGWVKMGNVEVGDIIRAPDGTDILVTGVYPQGEKEIYKITFNDGRTAESCKEHIWKVYNKHWKTPYKNMTLEEIILWKQKNKGDLYVPLTQPQDFPEQEFLISPYVMGALLGDGYMNKNHLNFSSKDQEILDRISRELHDDYTLYQINDCDYALGVKNKQGTIKGHQYRKGNSLNIYKNKLYEYDLYGKLSNDKFIPAEYKFSSIEQRFQLLQGLIDTDGYVGKNGTLHYTSVSEQLIKDIQDIVWSLGGICHVKIGNPTYRYNDAILSGQKSYNLTIRHPEMEKMVHLDRKKSRLSKNYQYKNSLRLKIDNIEHSRTFEAQCIMVDHDDHLYVTDNYIVTHNTLLAKSISRMLDVPFTMVDATSLTEAGYVGDDVESILASLLQAAEGDVEKAQKGIIYVDEIDKLARRGDSASITRDVSGEGVQQALLKILEGTVGRVPPDGGRKHPNQELINVDTTNILFICGGAFVGLDKIVERRINSKSGIGFNAELKLRDEELDSSNLLKQLSPKDLTQFGLMPEFIGRLPIRASLDELKLDQLVQVLTEPKNSIIKQAQALFKLENVDLEFSEAALEKIAQLALDEKTGARGLRSIIDTKLLELNYQLPTLSKAGLTKITVTPEFIDDNGECLMSYDTNTVESNIA